MAVQRSGSGIDMQQFDTVDPRMEEVQEGGLLVIRIHLPGFKKENLEVQLNSSGLLKVSGERSPQPGGSSNRWSRFRKDITVPQDCNPDEIRAKFSGGVLQVSIPKLQQQEPAQESVLPPQEQRPSSTEQEATQKSKPSSPPMPQEPAPTKEAQAPVASVPAAEGSEDKDRSKTEKEKEGEPETAPSSSKGSDSSPTLDVSGLRRRRSFVPKVGYGGGLSTKARGPGLKTAVALLLLLAGLWFAYVNYRAEEGSSTGSTTLTPYPHWYYYGDRI